MLAWIIISVRLGLAWGELDCCPAHDNVMTITAAHRQAVK